MKTGIRIQRRNRRKLGIGDLIQFTSLPENYYHHTGEKLVDVDKLWVFDHNPYVERDVTCENIINLWKLKPPMKRHTGEITSLAHRHCIEILGEGKFPILRHPRLYFNEDQEVNTNMICVHSTGVTSGGLPNQVIEHLHYRYSGNYKIIQVGSKTDVDTPFQDLRGLDIWDSVKVISKCGVFVGIPSGPSLIANCYPRVVKKIIFKQYRGLGDLRTVLDTQLKPCKNKNGFEWVDFNWQLYNPFEYDHGITMSYRKI